MLATVMDLFSRLGPAIGTEFAPRAGELPQAFFYGCHAAERLADHLARATHARTVVVVFDARTRQAAGAPCLHALHDVGIATHEVLVPDPPLEAHPTCDDRTLDALQTSTRDADAYVAVGSGVINDLTKWLAARKGVPYAVFATAASMNGYASANVAATIKGVKSLFRARAPLVIAADPAVLADAPYELTAAGLGDVIAKPVSTTDWLVNHTLFAEPFSGTIAAILDDIEPSYLERPQSLARRDAEALRSLFEALVFSGCAMTLQGSSLPASGGEHLVSHTLDMFSAVDGSPHDLHGRQVGVATIFAAALYEQILQLDAPRFNPDTVQFIPEVWGPYAESVREQFEAKRQAMHDACSSLPTRWEALRDTLRPKLRSPGTIKECLRDAGAAHRLQDIACTRERFLLAVQHCAAMRGRFTSIDLAWATGVLPSLADALVDTWLL